ncbi:hypothetical protein [Streptomyces bauhiniae]|uniref:hypothetical protein n=1 Tax=Streptomyces bauhiniae TaxID=2340725 RepID=UPI0035E0E05A
MTPAGLTGLAAFKADAPRPLSHDGFARLVRPSRLPAVAIGGVVPADLPGLRGGAGAVGAAVVSGVCAVNDPRAAALAYARAWSFVPR